MALPPDILYLLVQFLDLPFQSQLQVVGPVLQLADLFIEETAVTGINRLQVAWLGLRGGCQPGRGLRPRSTVFADNPISLRQSSRQASALRPLCGQHQNSSASKGFHRQFGNFHPSASPNQALQGGDLAPWAL